MWEAVHQMWGGRTLYCEPSETEVRQRPSSHYQEAIAEHFVEFARWLDIRPLWRDDNIRFFRVNFWNTDFTTGERRIVRSVFLAIEDLYDGLCVREI